MARVTVEDCLDKVPNRFALVVLAAERARQLSRGASAGVDCDNKPAVTALLEIAEKLPRERRAPKMAACWRLCRPRAPCSLVASSCAFSIDSAIRARVAF